jgi:hypothetical protein
MPTHARRLLKEKEQAELLNICLRTMITLRQKRLIPHVRLNGAVRYDPIAVQRALDKLSIKELA